MSDATLVSLPAGGLADLIRSRRASSVEIVRAHLERIERVNPGLGAVVVAAAERALEEARAADRALARGRPVGRLHGVPVTIKDSFDTAGVISTWGTLGRARHVPAADASAVARLRAAGAILLGKTNTSELTMSYETENLLFGPTRNPYDLSRSPGGSSGGSAAAVAACLSPLDLGSDAAGSIRIPAHFCGVAGLKPTAGRVPRTGHAISFRSHVEALIQVGPLARTVGDLALALALVSGPDGTDPAVPPVPLGDPAAVRLAGLRAAVASGSDLDPPTAETAAALADAGRALAEGGVEVREVEPPWAGREPDLLGRLVLADGGAWLGRMLASAGSERSRYRLPLRPPLGGEEAVEVLEAWARLRAEMLAFMSSVDLLLCPVTAAPAPPLGTARRSARPATATPSPSTSPDSRWRSSAAGRLPAACRSGSRSSPVRGGRMSRWPRPARSSGRSAGGDRPRRRPGADGTRAQRAAAAARRGRDRPYPGSASKASATAIACSASA